MNEVEMLSETVGEEARKRRLARYEKEMRECVKKEKKMKGGEKVEEE